jgi:hypothetical protein
MAGPIATALFPKISHPQKRALLAAYVTCGRISQAASAANVQLRLHYYWKKGDPVYLEAWQEAQEMVGEMLEDEARRRAHDGVIRTKFYKETIIAEEIEYSDALLIFLLKGAKPEKYRERFEHTGPSGGAIQIHVVYDDTTPTPETS